MRYEYTETQPEYRIPVQEIRNPAAPASDIPDEIPEDEDDDSAEPAEYPEIAVDTDDTGRVELTEAPEIPEDTEPYRPEVPKEYPEIPEDVPEAGGTEYPGTVADTDQPYYPEIPEDTMTDAETGAKTSPEIPEIPVDTETGPETAENEPDNTEIYARAGEWPRAKDNIPIDEALSDANPRYDEGEEWQVNCQRCVPAYEMRRRGFDVSATSCGDDLDPLSYNPFDIWEEPDVISCPDDDESFIVDEMSQWEDGARAQVVVMWAEGEGGHAFIAEKVNGEIRFVDPQTGDAECSDYFKEVEPGTSRFCRIDNLQPSERILECCKEARKP